MRKLIISIPIENYAKTVETLYHIGVQLKVSGDEIFADCKDGELPEKLINIDRDFAVEITADKPQSSNP